MRRLSSLLLLLLAAAMPAQQSAPGTPIPRSSASPAAPAATDTVSAAGQIFPPRKDYRFPLNETYVYLAEWRLWTAGTATLRLEPAGREHHVTGTADATGFASVLYHVHDRFDAYFDPATYCSTRISKHTEEGFRRLETNIFFDVARKRAILDEKNLKNGTTKRQENEIPGCVTDVVSGVFYVGSLPLAPGGRYEFPLNDGGRTILGRAEVEGTEEMKIEAGTFRTVRVQITASGGRLKDRGKIWIWYDETTRVPVQMRSRLFWGTLTFRLQRIDRK